jgi:hypothetical protein
MTLVLLEKLADPKPNSSISLATEVLAIEAL